MLSECVGGKAALQGVTLSECTGGKAALLKRRGHPDVACLHAQLVACACLDGSYLAGSPVWAQLWCCWPCDTASTAQLPPCIQSHAGLDGLCLEALRPARQQRCCWHASRACTVCTPQQSRPAHHLHARAGQHVSAGWLNQRASLQQNAAGLAWRHAACCLWATAAGLLEAAEIQNTLHLQAWLCRPVPAQQTNAETESGGALARLAHQYLSTQHAPATIWQCHPRRQALHASR